MKVKMKTVAAGPNFSAQPGDVINVSDEQGAQLCAGGYADPVKEPEAQKAETATEKQSENAAAATAKGKKTDKGDDK